MIPSALPASRRVLCHDLLTPVSTDGEPVLAARSRFSSRTLAATFAGLAALAPCLAPALEFECSLPGDTRFLSVDIPGESHLCEVSVTGESGEGERRVLWYADNETLFCSAKAYELRDKYADELSFDCSRWPDEDGVDLLSARQRAILDAELTSVLADRGGAEASPPLSGVRAVASTPFDGEAGMLALQFLDPDGGGRLRLIADSVDRWSVVGEVDDLSRRIDPVPGLRVRGAFIRSISASGALEVVTLLEPEGTRVGESESAACEGRQTFRPDGDDLVPSTAHRHACTADLLALDPG